MSRHDSGRSGLRGFCCHVRGAFTLIELLVVVSIIALLIAILLPALGKARESARDLACLNGQRQMLITLAVYAHDSRGYYPTWPMGTTREDLGTGATDIGSTSRWRMGGQLLGFMLAGKGYIAGGWRTGAWQAGRYSSKALYCPSDPNTYEAAATVWSYNYRVSHSGDPVGTTLSVSPPIKAEPIHEDVTRWQPNMRSSQLWLMTDYHFADNAGVPTNPTHQPMWRYNGYAVTHTATLSGVPGMLGINTMTLQSNWHANGSNVAYLDGHASKISNTSVLGDPSITRP